MNSRDESFQPESIDERLQQLKHAVPRPDGSTTPEARLVQDLRTVHADYTRSGQRVWDRLSPRLAEQNEPANNLRLLINQTVSTERLPYMQVEQSTTRLMPNIQPGKHPRKSRRIFTLVAALLLAMLLVGSALVIVTNIRQPRSTTTTGEHTPKPKPTSTQTTSFVPFPAQDCPSIANQYANEAWYQLCKAGEFVLINQSRSPKQGYNETLEAAYADRNMLFVICDFGPLSPKDALISFNRVQIEQGAKLLPGGMGAEQSVRHDQHITWVATYDTSNLPAGLQMLTLKLNSELTLMNIASEAPIYPPYAPINFAPFSVPLHGIQVVTPQQTVTANGIALTFNQARIGSTVTQLFLSSQQVSYTIYRKGFKAVLQTANGQNSYTSTFMMDEKETVPAGFELRYEHDLSANSGTWTLTLTAPGEPQPWVFHFTVSA